MGRSGLINNVIAILMTNVNLNLQTKNATLKAKAKAAEKKLENRHGLIE